MIASVDSIDCSNCDRQQETFAGSGSQEQETVSIWAQACRLCQAEPSWIG